MSAPALVEGPAARARREAWAWLAGVAEPPCAPLAERVAAEGPEAAVAALRDRPLPPVLERPTAARRGVDRAAAELELVAALGGRLVTPDDDEWPRDRFGALLGRRGAGRDLVAPLALWVRGEQRLDAVSARAVSIVGTRATSGYGEHVTGELAHDLARDGWTVVSGAAYGIDGHAHRAALLAEGTTVAVLGCGIDVPYPRGHARLLERVAGSGLVVSEYAPGTPPARHRFLARNRLVAALGAGVVVVEAALRSGATSTARWAADLGRPVMAVPGPVTALTSTGCHRLIREGAAVLVTSASEVAEVAGPMGQLALDVAVPGRRLDGLDPVTAQVLDGLPARSAAREEAVSLSAGVVVDRVRSALAELELLGLAAWTEDGWVRTRVARSAT
ncbi:DNA-processing protein DprA [Rhodococcus aerolatus]